MILAEVIVVEKDSLRECVLLSKGCRKWWSLRTEGLKRSENGRSSEEPIVTDSVPLSAEHEAKFATSRPTQGDGCCKDPRLELYIKMTFLWFQKPRKLKELLRSNHLGGKCQGVSKLLPSAAQSESISTENQCSKMPENHLLTYKGWQFLLALFSQKGRRAFPQKSQSPV